VYFGAALVINPLMALASAVIGFCIYLTSEWISLGTVGFACLFPLIARRLPLWNFTAEESGISIINSLLENLAPIALSLAVVLIYASAIGRMISGDEPRIPLIKKKSK
jgi:glycerol-3-phosphate acyltransferase PlsY